MIKMKTELGFICNANQGKTNKIPKDYFGNDKYITFRSSLVIGPWFKSTGYIPEFVRYQEEFPQTKDDIYTLHGVNIFLRDKFESKIIKFQPMYLQPVDTLDW
jgi:hypothetical protein